MDAQNFKPLTAEEKRVIIDKGTEAPFSGKYYLFNKEGIYTCKQCGAALFRSDSKFDAGCGWPSFDDAIPGAVKRVPDADGKRVEIVCANCGAHLGHVFVGEGFTPKNTRHCVNSVSLEFKPLKLPKIVSVPVNEDSIAIFAGGCFWGVEYLMEQQKGVISVESGYIGGRTKNPTYEEVCTKTTGFAEAVRIKYNPKIIDYETLAKLFFEIHDPTQLNRQGPDVGDQYRSEVFYTSDKQKEIALKLIKILKDKGLNVVTKVTKATEFYKAEAYHQDYYKRKGTQPYCHIRTKRF
ncbi:MAG: bifunctional methionine sulfoxide reductase B/A protein [Thiovulaceae bacterium]|nr:bifunctional methionine sulfoxide reductase B/A protein [Sulfurimonadaceae bacterium]